MPDKNRMRTELPLRSDMPPTLGWPDLIELADTPAKVVGVAKDYIAAWDPWEIAGLPEGCHPPAHFVDPTDLVEYAFTLAQHERQPGAADPGLQRLAAFFSRASQRVAMLMSAAPPAAAGNDAQA